MEDKPIEENLTDTSKPEHKEQTTKKPTLIQRFGGCLTFIGGLVALIGLWSIAGCAMDLFEGEFDVTRLIIIAVVIIIAIPLQSLGAWLRTPKPRRGKLKIFYDSPDKQKVKSQKKIKAEGESEVVRESKSHSQEEMDTSEESQAFSDTKKNKKKNKNKTLIIIGAIVIGIIILCCIVIFFVSLAPELIDIGGEIILNAI